MLSFSNLLLSFSYHDSIFAMKSPQATLVLRIPAPLHRRLKQEARDAEMSLNRHCRMLLSRQPGSFAAERPPSSYAIAAGDSRPMEQLQSLSAEVLEAWGGKIEGLALFGSFARRRETENSDVHLLVVLSQDVTLDRDIYSRWQSRKICGHEVAPLFVQVPAEGERIGGLWYEVAIDGIVLFDRDLRLNRFLSGVRDLIAGGRVKRMITHGHPYWVYADQVVREDPRLEAS
jgi:predicted nucleotidyltransferase